MYHYCEHSMYALVHFVLRDWFENSGFNECKLYLVLVVFSAIECLLSRSFLILKYLVSSGKYSGVACYTVSLAASAN